MVYHLARAKPSSVLLILLTDLAVYFLSTWSNCRTSGEIMLDCHDAGNFYGTSAGVEGTIVDPLLHIKRPMFGSDRDPI